MQILKRKIFKFHAFRKNRHLFLYGKRCLIIFPYIRMIQGYELNLRVVDHDYDVPKTQMSQNSFYISISSIKLIIFTGPWYLAQIKGLTSLHFLN